MSAPITPETRVGELIESHPEAEEILVDMAPAFKALRNPVLRRTVARVATLEQAARVGGVPVREMVRTLRRRLGQDDGDLDAADDGGAVAPRPSWTRDEAVVVRIDGGALLERGETPVASATAALQGMVEEEVLLLTAPFQPAPLIDALRGKGHEVWVQHADEEWRVWVRKGAA